MNKGPYTSLLVDSLLFDKLKDLRCMLENHLEVCVFGRENIEQESLVVTTEPLQRLSQDITLLRQERSYEATATDPPVMRVDVAYAKINNFGHEGLMEIVESVNHLISDLGKTMADLYHSLLIVCHTDKLYQITDTEQFRSCVIKTMHESFGLDLSADNIIFGIGSEMLSSKISLIIETRIINGFFMMREHLQSFFSNKSTICLGKMDIVESEQLLNAVQGFLKDGFRLVDILEDSQRKGEPFIEIVLRHLTRNIRCVILDPLSSKFNLKPDLINQIAHELIFEEQMKESISKNTRYHLGKLQQPCEENVKALKTPNKWYRFPGRKFAFIAYPLREDIRPTVLKLEESLASFRRKVTTMKKMIFEIDGNIQQSIVGKADLKKSMRNRDLTDEFRKRILS
ncbi:uncharacterized protein LOC123549678 isoform X2 [Mercenaria mercenaria]|nr:uncharacterized protein LOC123549678 isoform X2 [Mercenaria mercenaria]